MDPASYRDGEEVSRALQNDPLRLVEKKLDEGRTAQIVNALQGGGGEGMLVLERHLADLVRAERIRQETACSAANDVSTLTDYLRGGP